MPRILKWSGVAVGAFAVLAIAAAGYVWVVSEQIINRRHPVQPEALPPPSAAALAAAPHQMRLLGCFSCHGEGLSGKAMPHDPGLATVHAPNVPLKAAAMTDEQFAQVLRQGVRPDGRAIWMMPSRSMSRLTPEETAAIIAYVRSVPRSGAQTPPVAFHPLGRLAIVRGRMKPEPVSREPYLTSHPVDLDPALQPGRRMAALVCSECHGPALKGVDPKAGTAPDLAVVGAYDLAAFTTLMRKGKALGGRELGLMTAISNENLKFMTDAEIADLHAYLKARAERRPG